MNFVNLLRYKRIIVKIDYVCRYKLYENKKLKYTQLCFLLLYFLQYNLL